MNRPISEPVVRVQPVLPDQATVVRAIPDDFPMPDLRRQGKPPSAIYRYRNADGTLAALIARYETPNGKLILPFTVWSLPDGRKDWYCKGLPDARSLYRLPEMLSEPDKPVLLSEGEKCADAVAAALPGYASTTWQGGCNADSMTDFDPVHGRIIIYLPDNDESGEKAAVRIGTRLRKAGAASIWILDIARLARECGMEPTPGFDIADAIEQGLDAARFEELLELPGMLRPVEAPPAEACDASDDLPGRPRAAGNAGALWDPAGGYPAGILGVVERSREA